MQHNFFGFITRARVQVVTKGPKKRGILFYYGCIWELKLDLARFAWPKVMGHQQSIDFLHYNMKLGLEMLHRRTLLLQLAITKWPNFLLDNFCFKQSIEWAKKLGKKEVGFMWQFWHKTVAVNMWRESISRNIDRNYSYCDLRVDKSIIHRFWTYQLALQARESVNNLICFIGAERNIGLCLLWKHVIFSTQPSKHFYSLTKFWSFFRSVMLQTLQIARNDQVLNYNRWHYNKIMNTIWQGFIDYG